MKITEVICDTCGNILLGHGWSTLWAKAAKLGWIKGMNAQNHYCSAKCMVLAEFTAKTERKNKEIT